MGILSTPEPADAPLRRLPGTAALRPNASYYRVCQGFQPERTRTPLRGGAALAPGTWQLRDVYAVFSTKPTDLMSSIAKSIDLLAEGDTLEAATEAAVAEAAKTIDNIKSVYVDDYRAVVEEGRIQSYRVHAKITFVIQEGEVD